VLREGGSEILAFFVSDAVVRLLDAVAMQDLHADYPDVKKLGHQVILLSHPQNPSAYNYPPIINTLQPCKKAK
jgi:hypothetical protein